MGVEWITINNVVMEISTYCTVSLETDFRQRRKSWTSAKTGNSGHCFEQTNGRWMTSNQQSGHGDQHLLYITIESECPWPLVWLGFLTHVLVFTNNHQCYLFYNVYHIYYFIWELLPRTPSTDVSQASATAVTVVNVVNTVQVVIVCENYRVCLMNPNHTRGYGDQQVLQFTIESECP